MAWKRGAALLLAGLFVMACGGTTPTAQVSPVSSPTPSNRADATPTPTASSKPPSPKPTPTPSSTPPVAASSVKCSGGPGTAMVVIARTFVYDMADPINPRLVCRGTETTIQLLDGNSIAYTTVVANHVVIVRRNLTTGAESQVAQLREAPQTYYYGRVGWTWDGSLEVYSTSNQTNTSTTWQVQVHLWSNGADHVLFTIQAGPGGLESRWSPRPILAFSPDKKYVAISDFGFAIYGSNIRIFSVADRRQQFLTPTSASGGTWIANDRFAWAELAGSIGPVKEWTPIGGVKVLRSESSWYGVAAASDAKWIAGTRLDATNGTPRVFIAPLGPGRTFRTGLASNPGFVSPTVVWYAEERVDNTGFSCIEPCIHPTAPYGVIHALDVAKLTDRIVRFRAGQAPKDIYGNVTCCSTE